VFRATCSGTPSTKFRETIILSGRECDWDIILSPELCAFALAALLLLPPFTSAEVRLCFALVFLALLLDRTLRVDGAVLENHTDFSPVFEGVRVRKHQVNVNVVDDNSRPADCPVSRE
jgi:hypothetical protein